MNEQVEPIVEPLARMQCGTTCPVCGKTLGQVDTGWRNHHICGGDDYTNVWVRCRKCLTTLATGHIAEGGLTYLSDVVSAIKARGLSLAEVYGDESDASE